MKPNPNKRGQVWSVKLTPGGEFLSAVYECVLCDLVVSTHNPTNAMMQVCDTCATKEPSREDVDRIIAAGFFDRTNAMIQVCDTCATKEPSREDVDRIIAAGLLDRRKEFPRPQEPED